MLAEPLYSIAQAKLKIEWADTYIGELRVLCNALIQTYGNRPRTIFDPNTGNQIIEISPDAPLPIEITLRAGDIIANLRASLDYVWMGLRREHTPGATKGNMPLAKPNRKDLEGEIKGASIKSASAKIAQRILANDFAAHRDIANGGNRFLCALNDLSNWNKHRLLLIIARRTEVKHLALNSNRISMTFANISVQDGIPLASFAPSLGHVEHKGETAYEIVFGEHDFIEGEALIPTLTNFAQATLETVSAFEREFSA